jgi:hypothetical protein
MFFDGEEIKDLPLRTKYIVGPAGPTGNQGENGVGVITGGTTGQVLAKKSNADYDTEWVNQSGGGGGSGVVTWGAITGLLSNQTDLQDALNLKAPSTNIPASSITGLATVATSGSYNDLLNKPTIPNAQVNSDWSSITGISQILNKPNLAVVATSGSYNDLVDKPTIPSGQVNSDWSSVTGVSQILNKPTLSVVATSGSYTDLSNKPTYSDVGAAPSSGISPSAISGIAVITTDPRLSDSRTPTGSAAGDLSGVYPNPNVVKLQGYSVSATSPANGQILQWGGESWLPASIPQGGSGGGGISYFLNFNESAIGAITGLPTSPNSPKKLSRIGSITQSSYTSAHLSQANYDLICGFVSDPLDPNVTQIPAGLWDFNIWASSDANNLNQTLMRLFVYKYNGSTTTLLAESDDIFIYDPTVTAQYIASVVFPSTAILETDRIYIELRGKGATNNRTITISFGGSTPSHLHTTLPSVAGTGVVKVVNGQFVTPASTIVDADVSSTAAISQGKIAGLTESLDGKITDGGGIPKIIELTQDQYDNLTSEQVDQPATYVVNSTTTQNATTYQGKEFGGSKPVSLLGQPVVIGSVNRVSPNFSIASIDWIQVSPIDPTKFYFSQNIGGGASAAMWRGTLTRDSANRISGGTNSYGGQQAIEFSIFNGTKGGGIYDADTVFIPDERNTSTDNSGRILKVDFSFLPVPATSEAWNFATSSPAVVRADISSQLWYPDDCMVDRANNKLFVGSGSASTNSNGSSVARFSIDPTTKALTPDSWVKAVTANGTGINFIRRLTLLPDGYIFVANHNLSTNTPSFQTFDAYGSASGNGVSVGISYASGNIVQGVAFKADANAPSGIGYILIAPRNGSEKGKIYAYDYQGAGVVNTTATNSTNLTTIGKNAGLWTNALTLEIGSIAVTPDGAILVGLRSGTTTPIPRSIIAFNWIPYSKSGTLSTQNTDNVNITGGSIYGVRNLAPKVEYINSSRSWWKDEFAKFIRVQAWSAGGGGGSGRKDPNINVIRSGGGGGGGGGYFDVLLDASTINTATVPISITIGGGGAGGAAQTLDATNGNNGTQGGNTSWSSVLILLGGGAGAGGSLTAAAGGTGSLNGNAGGYAAADGGAIAGNPNSIIAPVGVGGTGGGAGGGLPVFSSGVAGSSGGISFYGALLTAAAGGTAPAGNGAAGSNTTAGIYQVGCGGGGGASAGSGPAGSGGAGGLCSGGGGGGASQSGNSGAGGVGGNGFMIVTTYY